MVVEGNIHVFRPFIRYTWLSGLALCVRDGTDESCQHSTAFYVVGWSMVGEIYARLR